MANHVDEYLGLWPWAPGGYGSARDEQAIMGATARNIRQPALRYARRAAGALDRGDEHFCRNANAYIPVLIAGYGEIRANIHQTVDNPNPAQPNPPSMRQLTQSLYNGVNALWQRIRQDTHTNWG